MAEPKIEVPNDEASRLDDALAWLKTMPRSGTPRTPAETVKPAIEEKKPDHGSE